ncbi:plasmid mobilization protein [Endozoicomonas acroporae]|uniref:plasmid mobilization protein n=1 Tax=Endozoicomonas acroporae TaxID=1701104 RepID=UPI003D79F34F
MPLNKNKYCYYHLTKEEKEYAKQQAFTLGFNNLSSYIRASLFDSNYQYVSRGQPDSSSSILELKFRVTEDELLKIKEDASSFHKTISEYVRLRLLKKIIIPKETIKDENLVLLKKLLGIIKYHFNIKKSYRDITKNILTLLNRIIENNFYGNRDYQCLNKYSIHLVDRIKNGGDTLPLLVWINKELENHFATNNNKEN